MAPKKEGYPGTQPRILLGEGKNMRKITKAVYNSPMNLPSFKLSKRAPLAFLLTIFFAQTLPAQEVPLDSTAAMTPAMSVSFFSGNSWIKASVGYDYSFFGDLNNSSRNYGNFLKQLGAPGTITAGAQTGNSSLKENLELGLDLDPDNSLSFDIENIASPTLGWSQSSNGTVQQSLYVTPNLISTSLNYSRVLFKQAWGRTVLLVGAGYYHTDVNLTQFDDLVSGPTVTGTFSGDILGGTLGVGQIIKLGNSFGLECSVKARFADFSEVTTNNTNPNNANASPGPYHLVVVQNKNSPPTSNFPDNTDYLLWTSQTWMNQNPGLFRYADVDYSGLSGDISLSYYF